jgi:kumamolisin
MKLHVRLLFVCAVCCFAAVTQAQQTSEAASLALGSTAVARPHRGQPRNEFDFAGNNPPWETPASLACIYRLAHPLVPGCPVLETSAVPTGGKGLIVIVSAFDNPPAMADLNVFSQRFGLPRCDKTHECFRKVFATGVRPAFDPLWAQGASVVTEYAHAFAPHAQILLVEAASPSLGDMWYAVKQANQVLVNNGGGQMILPFSILEERTETEFDRLFTAPGVVYISGNEGSLGFWDYPAMSPNVIALGGSGLLRDNNGQYIGEVATAYWAGGQSKFESRPSYQDGIQDKVGTQRGIPDVAFVSDPLKGAILYYTSVPLNGFVGWIYEGNVGVAEAGFAGIINRAHTHAASTQDELNMLYGNLGNDEIFHDIVKGKAFDIPATPGWDVLTGIGTPIGLEGK